MKTIAFNRTPCVTVKGYDHHCWVDWDSIGKQLSHDKKRFSDQTIISVEIYPGADEVDITQNLKHQLNPGHIIRTGESMKEAGAIRKMIQDDLTEDPVFGRLTQRELIDFFDPERLQEAKRTLQESSDELILILGTGAQFIHPGDILLYADMSRWEIQMRFRQNQAANLGDTNYEESPSQQYKRAFFVDWRVTDKHKIALMDRIDYVLDTHKKDEPKMISGEAFREGLRQTSQQPFCVAPYFDPAPWGGNWMKERFDLPPNGSNYGWAFNCVPEENSLFLCYGNVYFEIPSIDLVYDQALALLGPKVFQRFGAEFPIRFDYLDTMGGGNLSFQVHPTTHYIRENFGVQYTQDESYYIMDAKEDGTVYLGLKEGVRPEKMLQELIQAQEGDCSFDAEKYVNKWPAQKHDHFLIPAGTPHCSGKNTMVLEISATPYIFTFKLWDWGRVGLDGKPRPIHIHHGKHVIQWNRTSAWVRDNLINRREKISQGEGWYEERTGLHELEFIETRRHWFTEIVPHNTKNTVNVLCLVEGNQIVVESPSQAFDPFYVNYGEVFIVPAAVGEYTIRPAESNPFDEYATIKAYVR